jgi:hypothetical protein
MRSPLVSLTAATALAATLSSCGVNPAASVCNSVPLKTVTVPQLIYPTPGYTKLADNATFIVVAYPDAPSLAQTITITPKGGATLALGPLGAAPPVIPKPHAKVLPGQGAEYGVSLPKLAAQTRYAVNYRYANTANLCGQSTTVNQYMGTFTTV